MLLDEEKLTTMLQTQTEHLAPTPELWRRVEQQTRGRNGGRRWLALRAGLVRGLQIAAGTAVLASIALLPMLRNARSPVTPAGSGPSTPAPSVSQTGPGPSPPVQLSQVPPSSPHPGPPPPDAHAWTPPAFEGAGDLPLGPQHATFTRPLTPTKFTPEKARDVAAKQIGEPPADAMVFVDYVLLSLPDAPVIGSKKMDQYPVYLVTYAGVSVGPATGPGPAPKGAFIMPTGPAQITPGAKGKITAILDANTGDWIMGIAR